jgi:hypothetical protein
VYYKHRHWDFNAVILNAFISNWLFIDLESTYNVLHFKVIFEIICVSDAKCISIMV